MIKAVLFDLDGTFADTAPDLGYAVNLMRKARNLPPVPEEKTRPVTSSGARGLLGAGFGITPAHDEFPAMREEFLNLYEANLCRATRLFDGMAALVDTLEARAIVWGIVTNKAERFALPLMDLLGYGKRAACVIGGDTTGLTAALTLPVRVTDRRTWATSTIDALEPVLAALAGALGRGPGADGDMTAEIGPDAIFGAVMQGLIPLMLGGWAGSMIGSLAPGALGRYDLPLPLTDPPEVCVVATNVTEFAEQWDIPPDEMRLWVLAQELTAHALFASTHVRDAVVTLVRRHVGAFRPDPDAVAEHLGFIRLLDHRVLELLLSEMALVSPDVATWTPPLSSWAQRLNEARPPDWRSMLVALSSMVPYCGPVGASRQPRACRFMYPCMAVTMNTLVVSW